MCFNDFIKYSWACADTKLRLRNGEDNNLVKNMLTATKANDEKFAPELDQDEALFRWDERSTSGLRVRLELLGDSKLIVNWTNAN